jgi:hypothetical protein
LNKLAWPACARLSAIVAGEATARPEFVQTAQNKHKVP